MATQNKIATIIDTTTNETKIQNLVGEELEAIESEQNRLKSEFEAAQSKEASDQIAKAALLERLGITAEEAALLLS
jgi:hypothetical protein